MVRRKTPPAENKKQILTRLRVFQAVLAVTLGLLLAGGVAIWQIHKDDMRRLQMREEAMQPPRGTIGGPFTLTDQDGKTVRDTDFLDKYMLVYFGYTYCPDLCPTGLESIAHVMDELGPDAKKIQPVFITIDPARDTPAKLKEYVASFHPGITALTGTSEQVAAVASAYQVYYARGEDVDENDYLMDHSTLIYIMDPTGKFVTTFPDDVDPEAMVDALHALWDKAGQKPAKSGP
jgi:cytochrome oxidase Cu insertion factor (SCO1/SenC/PrrC family)